MGFFSYYRRVFVTAFKHSWENFDTISIIVAILSPIVFHLIPNLEQSNRYKRLEWEIPAAGLLCLLALRLVRAPYEIHREESLEKAGLRVEIKQLKEQPKEEPTGPQIWIEIETPTMGDGYSLALENTEGGTANNVQLAGIKGERHSSEPSEIVPRLFVGATKTVTPEVTGQSSAANQYNPYPAIDVVFQEAAKKPLFAEVHYEDTAGRKFISKFEITYNRTDREPKFRRLECRMVPS